MPHGPAHATPFVVTETDELEAADTDGTVSVAPGETATVADYRIRNDSVTGHVLGYGCNDETYTDYQFIVDDNLKFSTRSPLGIVNDPMSFKNDLGFTYPFERYVTIKVSRDSAASSTKKFACRMFVTEGGV